MLKAMGAYCTVGPCAWYRDQVDLPGAGSAFSLSGLWLWEHLPPVCAFTPSPLLLGRKSACLVLCLRVWEGSFWKAEQKTGPVV